MQEFQADDGVPLSYHVSGTGALLVCIPGGPMRDSAYLGDLGGLAKHWQLLRLDLRGTGSSAAPIDESSYRCDHLVRDVEALRRHLGVEKLSLLGHSAGANLALLYLAEHPERVTDLTLIAPSLTASGIPVSGDMRLAVARRRVDEPWFADAFDALDRVASGRGDESDWSAIAPFAYGRWDTTAQDHHAEGEQQINERAAAHFGAEGAFDPPATKAQLRKYPGPVSLIAGEVDINSPCRLCASSPRASRTPGSSLYRALPTSPG